MIIPLFFFLLRFENRKSTECWPLDNTNMKTPLKTLVLGAQNDVCQLCEIIM